MKLFLIVTSFFLLISCSTTPQELEASGDFEKALSLYKKILTEDYQNKDLRIKFTLCYFKNASKHIEENNFDKAERNIERGIIYNNETDPSIKNQYAEIIMLLGERLIETGDLEGSVESKKKYQKGYDLIEKAVFLSDDNLAGKKILNKLNGVLSEKSFQKSKKSFFLWQENKRNKKLLTESLKLIENSLIFNSENSDAKNLSNNILEKLLFESMKGQKISFRIVKIFHNTQTGISAFKIRFYNDSSQDIIISPEEFTIYDNNDQMYEHEKATTISKNYVGLLKRKKISPSRFANGLLVFNTGKKDPIFSSLVWRNTNDRSYEKEFPNKKILEIVNPE
ncbi:MAG: tetratricopeptide repeat protein [Candidatus Delongbacteria bacterium]|nr:tetratricopeptide repeat protein [Candidatus Delongbacteria bacterium]